MGTKETIADTSTHHLYAARTIKFVARLTHIRLIIQLPLSPVNSSHFTLIIRPSSVVFFEVASTLFFLSLLFFQRLQLRIRWRLRSVRLSPEVLQADAVADDRGRVAHVPLARLQAVWWK